MGHYDDILDRYPDDYKPWKNIDVGQCQAGTSPSNIDKQDKILYKYSEDQSLNEIKRYIDSTYSAHYKGDKDLQAIDAWFALGSADTSCRDTIIKYAWRLGKKDGYRKDLMKIIHYAIFCLEDCNRKGLK